MNKSKPLLQLALLLFKHEPLRVVFILFLMIVQSVLVTAALIGIAPVIDLYMSPDLENATGLTVRIVAIMQSLALPVNLETLAFILIGLTALKNVILIYIQHLLWRVQVLVATEVSLSALEAIFAASWSYYAQLNQGVVINTFTVELRRVWEMLHVASKQIVNINQILILSIIPVMVSWEVTCISLFIAGLLLLPLFSLSKWLHKLGKDNTDASNGLASRLKEIIDGAKVIRGFGVEKNTLEHYRLDFDLYNKVHVNWKTLGSSQKLLHEPLSMLTLVITLWMVNRYGIPISTAIVAIWAIKSILPLFTEVVASRNNIRGLMPSYEQVLNIRKHALDAVVVTGSRPFDGFKSCLKAESLTFNYPNRSDSAPVIRDINFQIEKGSTVAFVGRSGSGKSTLVDLLMGMNEPTEGSILVDGLALKEYDLVSYRRSVGFVPQAPVLFNCSILENIRLAKPDATVREVKEAIQKAYAEEFVSKLPEGLNTIVGDRGSRLSGGQCQRLALARALVHEPKILILDEATSALDSISENFIRQTIKDIRQSGDMTVISIAHRLSTIDNSDQIYVMYDGEIIENGTYDELIKLDGHFLDMVKS